MLNQPLRRLVRHAQQHGYAEGSVEPTGLTGWSIRTYAEELGYVAVANRDGDPVESELKPTPAEDANPASLSAMVGLGAQPLHTDGAHLRAPPDLVVLWTAEPNLTSTRIWLPWEKLPRDILHGMFVVSTGGEHWFAPAVRPGGSLRYDPGCMDPADATARELAAVLSAPPDADVLDVHWDAPGKLIVINNRRALHGRSAVADEDTERVLRRIALRKVVR